MKHLPPRMLLLISLWSATTSSAMAQPDTTPAATPPASEADSGDTVEMIPPASHWPEVVVSAAGALFVLAAAIGPLELAQSRRKAAYSQPGDEPVRSPGRKSS